MRKRKSQARDRDVPAAWDKNPSSWSDRLPIVALALIGCAIAAYLALYQWGVLATAWEPFFGDGTLTILNSRISHILPIPDAAMGAFGYFLDAAMGVIGGRARWRTMPWIVIVFGLAVGPFGIMSVMLVIFQPVLFDAWCTLCLASALVSVLMIGPAADELLASLQYLRRQHHQGCSLWRAFWGLKQ
ncbi:MAG: vitamin K epoxide reductase family protein [Candidatus Binatia bacterium]